MAGLSAVVEVWRRRMGETMAEAAGKAFRREIDLGDGSGVQVYEGDTADELLDKIADAQKHATAKIRAQNQEIQNLKRQVITAPESGEDDPAGPLPEFKGRTLTADEEFQLGQELLNPATAVKAQRKLLEAELGAPLDVARAALRRAEMTPRQIDAYRNGETFLLRHPEFVTGPGHPNVKAMTDFMTAKNMAFTLTNYERAFAALSAAGQLELRAPVAERVSGNGTNGGGADSSQPGSNGAADSASNGNGSAQPRFASTTIANRGSGTPRGTPGPKLPTAEEIDRMSAKEHARWINHPTLGAQFQAHEDAIERNRRRARG